ncbi:MAG: carbohydrate kinase family protein, partial [Acidobacteriaceae bacterium]|nr:carbohydrate kinase family protein [Acidobacteriaceae bacterium]
MRIPVTVRGADATCDIVTFGENSVDLLAVVPELPARNSKRAVEQWARLPGGQMATAAAAAACLGWRTRYVGTFGSDEHGEFLRGWLELHGVDLSRSMTVAGVRNRMAVVLVESVAGTRTVLWDRDDRLAFPLASLPLTTFESSRLLIVDSTDMPAAI